MILDFVFVECGRSCNRTCHGADRMASLLLVAETL